MTRPAPKAFFSYVRNVDEHDAGRLSRLRDRIQGEIRVQTGLDVEVFQDIRDLKWGDNWQQRLNEALTGSMFLIPVVTPGYFLSEACRKEYEAFRALESLRKISGIMLTIYYIETDELSDPTWRAGNAWAEDLASGQWADWRTLRLEPWETPAPHRRIEEMAKAFKSRLKDLGFLSPVSAILHSRRSSTLGMLPVHEGASETTMVASIASTAGVQPFPTGPTPVSPRRELIVDAGGSGSFRTVADAVSAARADDILLVRPGNYRESIVVAKSIAILGDGERDQIVLESGAGPVVRFDAPFGRIANITIRRSVDDPGATPDYAVWVTTGRLELDGCDITSASLACVSISGDAEPTIRRNRIHDSSAGGVFVNQRGRGTIEGNDIFGNALSNIEIADAAEPTVRHNRIRNAMQAGVLVSGAAGGAIEDNDIFANTLAGIEVSKDAAPMVRRNRVHDGYGVGLNFHDGAGGTIDDNDIFANAGAGVVIRTGADPVVRRNRIRDGKLGGVFVWEQGRGTLEENDVSGNVLAGVEVRDGGEPVVRRNTICRNALQAIWIRQGSGGIFEDNDLRRNGRGPWEIDAQCLANLKRSGNTEK